MTEWRYVQGFNDFKRRQRAFTSMDKDVVLAKLAEATR